MKSIARCVTPALLLAALVVPVGAQDANVRAGSPTAGAPPNLPLQVQIVIGRYVNDKRVSSLPFSLSMSSAPGSKAIAGDIDSPCTAHACPVWYTRPSVPCVRSSAICGCITSAG